MSNDETRSLEQRVAALERRIAQLEARSSRGIADIPPPPPRRPPVTDPARARERWFNSGEGWLGRAGVALVVVSFVFLYRYAVDQGWLTPAMRVALGVLVGAAMFVGGLLFFAERRVYRQILMGGGIVLLFLAGLVASELYALVPGPIAPIRNALSSAP